MVPPRATGLAAFASFFPYPSKMVPVNQGQFWENSQRAIQGQPSQQLQNVYHPNRWGGTYLESTILNCIVNRTFEFLNQDCILELGITVEIYTICIYILSVYKTIYYLCSKKNHRAASTYYYLGAGAGLISPNWNRQQSRKENNMHLCYISWVLLFSIPFVYEHSIHISWASAFYCILGHIHVSLSYSCIVTCFIYYPIFYTLEKWHVLTMIL